MRSGSNGIAAENYAYSMNECAAYFTHFVAQEFRHIFVDEVGVAGNVLGLTANEVTIDLFFSKLNWCNKLE